MCIECQLSRAGKLAGGFGVKDKCSEGVENDSVEVENATEQGRVHYN